MISPVFFSQSASEYINELIASKSSVFVLVDDETHQHCWPIFASFLNDPSALELIEVPSGETSKQVSVFAQIAETLCDLGADRKSLVINLGGGMISDLGAFVASAYMRGIDYVNVPTSLLGMVDAAHGGKTGVDLGNYKNLLGAMYPSEAVLIYPEFLQTLPEREYASGYAEALKHGLIANASLWEKLSGRILVASEMHNLLKEIIEVKVNVVKQDPKEVGVRKTLNFGHNIGHAIEAYYLAEFNPIPHGEAVIMGMIMENEMAKRQGLLEASECDTINVQLRAMYPNLPQLPSDNDAVLENLKKDKKNEGGVLYYSPITSVGRASFNKPFTLEECRAILESYE